MNIIKKSEGKMLNIALEGRLDTTAAPQNILRIKKNIREELL